MMDKTVPPAGGEYLAAGHESLALGVPASTPGTIYVLSVIGGVSFGPRDGRTILFGRNRPEVHVCVGENDRSVSRCHGRLIHREHQWWLSTAGRLPVRLPGSRVLFPQDEPIPLAEGYTPLFVPGSGEREHLLEVFVTGPDHERPVPRHSDPTAPPRIWHLSETERLALIVLGQRYLRHEAYPQPLTWKQTAEQLAELQPRARWSAKKVEHAIVDTRTRLSKDGVAGLTREEVGEPLGNALNDNLIRHLMKSTTLIPPDLRQLDVIAD
ncbi:FHA domain-containing protein [Amycolatopsis pigmentata]|uniref:FHA domain-containing protein n=1 Tax=Amycolatopsis pigmentata TaxID=450801 RepID=A0ABW5FPZ5_9PSEU